MMVETHARALVAALTVGSLTRNEMAAMFIREEMGDKRDVAKAVQWLHNRALIAYGYVSRGYPDWDVVKAWYVTYKGKSWLSSFSEGASL